MAITTTLNPAIDKTLEVPDFQVGQHARARLVALIPAGKGVNVTRGLCRLGTAATACGLVGRREEEMYVQDLQAEGAQCAFCTVEGRTRVNTTVLDPKRGTTTHLREEGFTVSGKEVESLRDRLAALLRRGVPAGQRWVAFCGSLPPGLETGQWVGLLRTCFELGARVLVDTSGEALVAAVKAGCVHTVKPNLEELRDCLGQQLTRADAPRAARALLGSVQSVLLTLGSRGAYAVDAEKQAGMVCSLERGEVRNTVGCGDAFLAGWLHGMESSGEVQTALGWAVAAGAASARADTTVAYTRQDVEELLPRCRAL